MLGLGQKCFFNPCTSPNDHARKFALLRYALACHKLELGIALKDRAGYGITYIHHPSCIKMFKESMPLRITPSRAVSEFQDDSIETR